MEQIQRHSISIFIFSIFLSLNGWSSFQSFRWTILDDHQGVQAVNGQIAQDFNSILQTINSKLKTNLVSSDFIIYEDRDLATSHFRMYLQVLMGIPVQGGGIRVWTDLSKKQVIQVEAQIESFSEMNNLISNLSLSKTSIQNLLTNSNEQKKWMSLVKAEVAANQEDPYLRKLTTKNEWQSGQLIKVYKVKGRRGHLTLRLLVPKGIIISRDYQPFMHVDLDSEAEFSLPALVYPIWEETPSGKKQSRVIAQLKHIKSEVPMADESSFDYIRSQTFLATQYDPVLGLIYEGQVQGYWSSYDINSKISLMRQSLPKRLNDFSSGGVLLEGRYATVSLHPDIVNRFSGLEFKPRLSSQMKPIWGPETDTDIPVSYKLGLLGRPIESFEDAYTRPAIRLSNHDPVTYINHGFDEVQVYYAIDTFMDLMNFMGFKDPELSTRPFNAFLYDPDIQMRNNAYYDADTINFTTYDSNRPNYARDNPTIWHELGHGVMDRLMGDLITLNDSGGLSEGMADFLNQLVISRTTRMKGFEGDKEFRIINKIGFNLTNESHDDGEAYGGAMYDILLKAQSKYGVDGILKVTDLTLDTMRFTRNHPGLTAGDWFNHMLFADALGREGVRAPGEFREIILGALDQRNFSFDGKGVAVFHLYHDDREILKGSEGTRGNPLSLTSNKEEIKSIKLKIKVEPGEKGVLTFPLQVIVGFKDGALQGAVHWQGEEKGDIKYVINSSAEQVFSDELEIPLSVTGVCDFVNREDGSCSDYVYIKLYTNQSSSPVAKKRFYVHVHQ